MPRRTLHSSIHAIAEPRFLQANGKFTVDNIDKYENFYLEAAREVKAGFEAEGLTQTAAGVQDIIDFSERMVRIKQEQKQRDEASVPLEKVIKIIEAPPQSRPLDEDILPDDYPMYADFTYVVDGAVTLNHLHAISVYGYKQKTGAKEVRRCDIYGRLERKKGK